MDYEKFYKTAFDWCAFALCGSYVCPGTRYDATPCHNSSCPFQSLHLQSLAASDPVISQPAATDAPVIVSDTIKPATTAPVSDQQPVKSEEGYSGSDTSKAARKKDRQNQVQFFKSDMESKNYNFYQRKEISQPLMPRYDLDSAVYQTGKKRQKQQQKYLARQYAFPARPKDQWELGLNIGSAFLSGNVKPYVTGPGVFENVGGGVTIRKALGYFFSLRAGYNFMMMTGRDWQPNENLEFNQALNGTYNPKVNYLNNPNLLRIKNSRKY